MPAGDPAVFESMRENYALASELGLLDMKSQYWSDLLARGRQDYGGKGDFIASDELWANFRNNVITKGLDNANVPEEAVERAHTKWRDIYRRLSNEIPDAYRPYLEEIGVGHPRSVVVDGIPVTQSSLEYAYMLSHLDPYLSDVDVVVDIGGGYGGLSRVLKRAFPEMRIVLLDLPEVNTIQTYFLRTCFDSAKFLYLRDVYRQDRIDLAPLEFDFMLLPGQLIEKLARGSFGLVINTRSMMEMDLPTISFYLNHIQDKLGAGGLFYCVNRYSKKTRLKDYPFDDKWYVSYSSPWPTFIDKNPHHELVAVRAAHRVANGLKEHAAGFPPNEGGRGPVRGGFAKFGALIRSAIR